MDRRDIRVAKAYQDLSTRELGERAGISLYQVWRWETGRPGVAPATAARIERALLSGNNSVGPDSGNEAA